MKHLITLSLLIFITSIIGCGNPQGRLNISGAVTLDGKPIEEGTISFEPAGEQPLQIRSGTLIRNGRYEMPKKTGLVSGIYLVSISAQHRTGKIIKTEMGDIEETVNLVPPEWEPPQITVTETGSQKFDFDIKTI